MLADPPAGPEEGKRVDRLVISADLSVKMRTGAAAAAACPAKPVGGSDLLADFEHDPAQRTVNVVIPFPRSTWTMRS